MLGGSNFCGSMISDCISCWAINFLYYSRSFCFRRRPCPQFLLAFWISLGRRDRAQSDYFLCPECMKSEYLYRLPTPAPIPFFYRRLRANSAARQCGPTCRTYLAPQQSLILLIQTMPQFLRPKPKLPLQLRFPRHLRRPLLQQRLRYQ